MGGCGWGMGGGGWERELKCIYSYYSFQRNCDVAYVFVHCIFLFKRFEFLKAFYKLSVTIIICLGFCLIFLFGCCRLCVCLCVCVCVCVCVYVRECVRA